MRRHGRRHQTHRPGRTTNTRTDASATAGGRGCGGLINREDFRDLTALLSLADAHAQGCPRADRIMAGLIECVGVQERVARTVGQRHEAKPLFGIEPLDGCVVLGAETRGGGPRRCGPRHVAWRSTIEGKVVIEAAAPAWASAAAVGHVQEKIVPIIIRVVHGGPCPSGKAAGLLPFGNANSGEFNNFPLHCIPYIDRHDRRSTIPVGGTCAIANRQKSG